jgi:alkylhydroperoxidase family enzyme
MFAKLAGEVEMTPRESAAVDFAERLATVHDSMDEAFMRALRGHFTDAEIIELGLVTGAFITLGRLHRAFDIAPMEEGAHAAFRIED